MSSIYLINCRIYSLARRLLWWSCGFTIKAMAALSLFTSLSLTTTTTSAMALHVPSFNLQQSAVTSGGDTNFQIINQLSGEGENSTCTVLFLLPDLPNYRPIQASRESRLPRCSV